jgi:hypothetical protein
VKLLGEGGGPGQGWHSRPRPGAGAWVIVGASAPSHAPASRVRCAGLRPPLTPARRRHGCAKNLL